MLLLISVYFGNAYTLRFGWRANEEINVVKYRLTYWTTNSTNYLDIAGRTTTNTSILLYSTNSYYFQLQAVTDIGLESDPTSPPLFTPIITPPVDFRIIGVQVSTNLSSWNTILQFTNFASVGISNEFYRLTIK